MIFRNLPAGFELCLVANHSNELARIRLSCVAQLLGDGEKARAAAAKAGPYEISSEVALQLELEGVSLGVAGEFPALSPSRWAGLPVGELLTAFRSRLTHEGGELGGIILSEGEEKSLRAFFAKNKRELPTEPWELMEIARHFFFRESIKIAVRPLREN